MKIPTVLTVSQVNHYVRSLLDGDAALAQVFLSGEISNFTDHYRSGHLYLSLKDDTCVIKAVMFASAASRLRFAPQNGMQVLVRGRVSLYEQGGQYQLYIEDMQPEGLGALHAAYEQLKNKLAAEGLFDAARKRLLPVFPDRVGVITSPTGAVLHDIQQVLKRRYPLAELVLCPVQVQGQEAAQQIVQAIAQFNASNAADVLIVARGGGSPEDLWTFNEELLVRAVAASEIPTISAVGHETDVTLCDFVADVRAATPSAAAELAVPDQAELYQKLRACQFTLRQLMQAKLLACRRRLTQTTQSAAMKSPQNMLALQTMRLDRCAERLQTAMVQTLAQAQQRLSAISGSLHAMSPLETLARGYAVVQTAGGMPLRSAAQTKAGEEITVTVTDGALRCTVNEVKINAEKPFI